MKGNKPNRLHTVTIKWSMPGLEENINKIDWDEGLFTLQELFIERMQITKLPYT